jgi:hypothetical protein
MVVSLTELAVEPSDVRNQDSLFSGDHYYAVALARMEASIQSGWLSTG